MTPLRLRSEALTCDLAPELGGAILSLRWREQDVLRPAPPGVDSARQCGCYPLVPWSNRIAGGRAKWNGKPFQLPVSESDPHAIHGIGWRDAWRIEGADETSAVLSLDHPGDERWPYAFRCEQAFALSPSSLDVTMKFTQRSAPSAPAGLGWHPFFMLRPGASVHFRAAGRWERSAALLPTHLVPDEGLDRPCDGLEVDHCFEEWDGHAELRDPAMRVVLSSSLPRIVAFTRPGRDSIALEPVSHVNNALGDPGPGEPVSLGIMELRSGEDMSATMRIEMSQRQSLRA